MRRTLRQFRVFLETNPYTAHAAATNLAPNAHRDFPLSVVVPDPRAVGPRQVPAAGGGARVPVGAVAGAGHGDRVQPAARVRLAGVRVAAVDVRVGARISAAPRRAPTGSHRILQQGQHRRPRRRRPAVHARHLLLALQLRREDLQRHLARRRAPHGDRQVPDVLRDGDAAAGAGRILALLVGQAGRIEQRVALRDAGADPAGGADVHEQAAAARERQLGRGDPGRRRDGVLARGPEVGLRASSPCAS